MFVYYYGVKSGRIRLRSIQSECGRIQTRITPKSYGYKALKERLKFSDVNFSSVFRNSSNSRKTGLEYENITLHSFINDISIQVQEIMR